LATGHTLGLQLGMDARRTIRFSALGMCRLDLLQQPTSTLGLGTRRAPPPGVVATARDLKHVAHQVHPKLFGMRGHEAESHCWCFAKKAVAFFKISRSISSRLFSSRKRRTSARKAPSPPAAPEPLPGNFLTQSRIEFGSTPRLLAASTVVYPC